MKAWRFFLLATSLYCGTADATPLVFAHYMTVFSQFGADYTTALETAYTGKGIGVGDAPLLSSRFISGTPPWGTKYADFVRYEIKNARDAGIDGFIFDYGGGGG